MTQPKTEKIDLVEREIEVLKVRFYNEDNSYCIAICSTEKTRQLGTTLTIKGPMPERPIEGTFYLVKGYVLTEKGGMYLKVKEAEPLNKRTKGGWIDYLVKEGPFIGDERAEQLFSRYGGDVIARMAESVENLTCIPGITEQRALELNLWAKRETVIASTKEWFYRNGLTHSKIAKIINMFGDDANKLIRKEPYRLMQVDGIGWIKADELAMKIGGKPNDPLRIRTGILHVIETTMQDGGHTCIMEDRLIRKSQELLEVDRPVVKAEILAMKEEGILATSDTIPEQTELMKYLEGKDGR